MPFRGSIQSILTGQIEGVGGIDKNVVYGDEDASAELDRLGEGVISVNGRATAANVSGAVKDGDIKRDGG